MKIFLKLTHMLLESIQSKANRIHFSWIVILSFILIYSCSLTIYYVEGDDAATAFYHVAGRNIEIQKPYEPYHSGYDYILSILPANEEVIRYTMILLSAIAQPIFVISLLLIVFQWINIPVRSFKANIISLIFLLSIPELFFMGLYYNPTIVAMAFVTIAHLLVRKYFSVEKGYYWHLLLSILLFSFGATLRWNIVVYGLIIVLDLLINIKLTRKQIYLVLGWGFFALFLFFGFLWVEGMGIDEIGYALKFEAKTNQNIIRSLSERIMINTPFFTPALLLLLIIGLLATLMKFSYNLRFLIFSFICFIVNYIFVSSFFYKVLAPIYVIILYFTATGIIWTFSKRKFLGWLSWIIIILITITPWILGIKILNARVWGPGFQLKDKYYSLSNIEHSPHKSRNSYQWNLGFGDGIGFAHPEGPRPLWGYGNVLIGGLWRNLYINDYAEYERMFNEAKKEHLPLVKVGFNNNMENILYAQGFITKEGNTNEILPNLFSRLFTNNRDSIFIYHLDIEEHTINNSFQASIYKKFQGKKIILYGEYYGKPSLIDSCTIK